MAVNDNTPMLDFGDAAPAAPAPYTEADIPTDPAAAGDKAVATAVIMYPDPVKMQNLQNKVQSALDQFAGEAEITNDKDAEVAGELLKAVVDVMKDVDGLWAETKRSAYTTYKKTYGECDTMKGSLPSVEEKLRRMISKWETKKREEERRRQREQEEILRQAAERKRRLEQEELERKAEAERKEAERLAEEAKAAAKAGDEDRAIELDNAADVAAERAAQKVDMAQQVAEAPLMVPTITVPAAPRPKPVIPTRTDYKYEVTDMDAVPREYLIVNDAVLSNLAKSSKGNFKIAGIRFYSVETPIVRTR